MGLGEHPITDDCIACWRFDELNATDNAVDATGNGHTAIQTGSPAVADGMINKARGVFSTTKRLGVAYNAALEPQVFTIACWIYVQGAQPAYACIFNSENSIASWNPWAIQWDSLGTGIQFGMWDGVTPWGTTSVPLSTGWHHIGATWNGQTAKVYINGVLRAENSKPAPATIRYYSRGCSLGRDLMVSSEYFLGLIDDVALYGTAKSPEWFAEIADDHPLWRVTTADSDGHQHIGGTIPENVNHVHVATNNGGGFGDPTNSFHIGAAQDGINYYNGVACSFADLADPEGWIVPADPLGIGYQLTNPYGSISGEGTVTFTQSSSIAEWRTVAEIASYGKFVLQGDFRVKLTYSNYAYSGTDHQIVLSVITNRVNTEGANTVSVVRCKADKYRYIMNNGTAQQVVGTAGTPASGTLEIERAGSVFKCYADGVQIGGNISHPNITTEDLAVQVESKLIAATGSVQASIALISGTYSNMAGWARETSGVNRGTQADMPDTLVVSCSDDSVDLIDPATSKLWLRSLVGDQNAIGANGGNTIQPKRAMMRNGVLFVAVSGTSNGGILMFDFRTDTIRLLSTSGENRCGALYGGGGANRGGSWLAAGRARGGISIRNSSKGWKTTEAETDWAIQNVQCNDVDLWANGEYLYWAIADDSGLSLFKWKDKYFCETPFVQNSIFTTGPVLACNFDQSNGDIYWMDASNIYRTAQTVWEASMDGNTFGATNTVAIAGTISQDSQKKIIFDSTYGIFLIADEGVYRSIWPGSFSLQYGKLGSVATYPILPDYDLITSISLSSYNFLNITATSGSTYYLFMVDLLSNTLLSSTDITELLVTEPSDIAVSL